MLLVQFEFQVRFVRDGDVHGEHVLHVHVRVSPVPTHGVLRHQRRQEFHHTAPSVPSVAHDDETALAFAVPQELDEAVLVLGPRAFSEGAPRDAPAGVAKEVTIHAFEEWELRRARFFRDVHHEAVQRLATRGGPEGRDRRDRVLGQEFFGRNAHAW